MNQGIFFSDRNGQTVLSPDEREGLKLSHISLMGELDEVEQRNINQGLVWLSQQTFKNSDYLEDTFLKKLHIKLFSDVWKWAGKFRFSEKNIGVKYFQIPVEISKFGDDVRYWIENETYEKNEIAARVHHRLVYIHPFANGNGRFSRIFTQYFCKLNAIEIPSWAVNLDPEKRRKVYIESLQSADRKNFNKLTEFMYSV